MSNVPALSVTAGWDRTTMDAEMLKQLYLLQMRKACAEMEHANQCAARDTQRGEWSANWTEWHSRAMAAFDDAEAGLRSNKTFFQ